MNPFHTFLLLLAFIGGVAQAQMADASFFPETKSVNPAVISRRSKQVISAVGRAEFTEKKQTLAIANGDAVNADSTTDVNVNSISMFRGGKGKGFTTELGADYVMGTSKDKAASESESHSFTNDANNYLAYIGLGFAEYFGLSYTHAGYESEFTIDENFIGQARGATIKTEVTAGDIKAAFRAGKGNVSFAGFLLHSIISVDTEVEGGISVRGPDKVETDVVGIAFGYASNKFHAEGGLERSLDSSEDPMTGKQITPMRLTGTIEGDVGPFTVGYTGRYFINGYFDIDRIIYNEFVYANSYLEPRLENTFNFSFGNSKGHLFGLSAYFTAFKSEETNTFFPEGGEVETTTSSYGASVRYTYVF